ncbi:MAG: hypothetical protein PQJ59_05245 [Spirochaetales bacterium]|nr:hypothetical protein [Spirochaetales bacterium]
MKKLLLSLSLLMCLVFALSAAEDRFEDLNDAQKLALSEAYQAVGEHFGANGEEDRGAAYEQTAEVLRKQIADLSEAARERQASMEKAALAEETPAVKQVSEEEQKAVSYYFRKLVRALLSENKEKVLSLLDEPLAMEGYLSGVPREKIEEDLDTLFDSYDLTIYDATELYDLENLTFSYDENTEDVVILEVNAIGGEDTPLELVIFWQEVQKFYFQKADKGWKVFGIL